MNAVKQGLIPTRPYLLRAFYDWILDNGWTPYVVVNSFMPDVAVPQEYVDGEGKIILNISSSAAQALQLTNQHVEFSARFSGVPMKVFAPVMAVEAIYARENGRGLVFSEEEDGGDLPPASPPTEPGTGADKSKGKPYLKVVK